MSTPQRPPNIPNEHTRRCTALTMSAFTTSKSRFFEPPYPSEEAFNDQNTYVVGSNTHYTSSAKVFPGVSMAIPTANSVFQRSQLAAQRKDEENEEDAYKSIDLQPYHKKLNFFLVLEVIVFVSLMGLLITSLINYNLQETSIWNLDLWKWCALIAVIFCGRLVTTLVISALVYMLERKLLFGKKAHYFVHGLKKSVQVFLWLSFVLLTWIMLIVHGSRSREVTKVLQYITKAIAGCLVGAVIWLLKTSVIKTLALSFHVKRFFRRIQESIFHQYVLQMLSGPTRPKNISQLNLKRMTEYNGLKEEVINVEKLRYMNQKTVSAWTMKRLISVIRRTKLSVIADTLNFREDDGIGVQNREIKREWQAKVAAVKIFNNVAKPGYECIEEEDLLRFMKMDEVNHVLPLFDRFIETGKINKSALEKWVLLLATFVFGNTMKTVFEAIIFVFLMHPFDVGDRCVIDGVQMVVEEMNILTTIFLRYDNEKITYPNSVLATKPISNFYRSPEMIDSVEFAINFSTTVEAIAALKERIKSYIESKPQHWRPSHSVQLKDIVDMNKITMTLYVTHTINFQNIAEKNSRTSDLILELKKTFEELGIRYHLLPQGVHVTYVG